MVRSPRLGHIYVSSEGPADAKIMCVGEAPGGQEEKDRRPFVGDAGQILRRYLGDRVGIKPESVFITNLCKYRPYKNDFRNALASAQLEEGLEELHEDIRRINPNVIVALGNWPLYFLTGKTNDKGEKGKGILNWRGSILPSTLAEGKKVVACLHPAFLLRSWSWHIVFEHDLREKVRVQSDFPDIRYPQYETFIDPMDDLLSSLEYEMARSEWLVVDIETFTDNTVACVGFADRSDRALVLTHRHPEWKIVTDRLFKSKAKKIAQFGTYDWNFLYRFYKLKMENYAFDTYIAAAELMPEFPRGLDFLVSIYTDIPYYKVERKMWKKADKKMGDFRRLWDYNAKDDIGEYIVAMKQMEELKDLYGWTPNRPLVAA